MCVAITGIVRSMDGTKAEVEIRGNRLQAEAGLVQVKVGDHVLVHAGYILQVISESENEEMEALWTELQELEQNYDPTH
mgnify:CR=1 FL=1